MPTRTSFRLLLPALLLVFAAGCATTTPSQSAGTTLDGRTYEELLETADEAARGGDFRAALTLYGEAQTRKDTAEIWIRIGEAQRELGLLQGAALAFQSAIKLDPDAAAAHESLGLALLALRETDQARPVLEKALELDPNLWQAHNALGVMADLASDPDAAIPHYEKALALYPRSAMLLNNLGYSHYLAGNDVRARHYFEAALDLGEYQPATLNLGLLHARRGHYRRAVEILATVVDRPSALNDVGFVAISKGDYDAAEALLEEAIRLSPVHYEIAQRNLALARSEGAY